MAKLKSSSKKNSIVSLKVAMEKLQRSLMLKKRSSSYNSQSTRSKLDDCEDVFDSNYVPKDVKEGHFAVIAMDDEDERPQRFVVALTYLSNPAFVKLLERAAEEYGFNREGLLTVPCSARDLERILDEQLEEEQNRNNNSSHRGVDHWGDSSRNMIKSCKKRAVFV